MVLPMATALLSEPMAVTAGQLSKAPAMRTAPLPPVLMHSRVSSRSVSVPDTMAKVAVPEQEVSPFVEVALASIV
jgi:hypothetical protein